MAFEQWVVIQTIIPAKHCSVSVLPCYYTKETSKAMVQVCVRAKRRYWLSNIYRFWISNINRFRGNALCSKIVSSRINTGELCLYQILIKLTVLKTVRKGMY